MAWIAIANLPNIKGSIHHLETNKFAQQPENQHLSYLEDFNSLLSYAQ
jgi:hypothetical protein